jgi:hypothetical protein
VAPAEAGTVSVCTSVVKLDALHLNPGSAPLAGVQTGAHSEASKGVYFGTKVLAECSRTRMRKG